MSSKKSQGIIVGMLGLICFFPCFYIGETLAADLPKAGVILPEIRLESPSKKTELRYLGLGPGKTFTPEHVDAKMVLIEILGVYCPECHRQMHVLNQLFNWIERDPLRSKKVKLMALAAGATAKEVDYFKKEHRISFPVIKDQYFNKKAK